MSAPRAWLLETDSDWWVFPFKEDATDKQTDLFHDGKGEGEVVGLVPETELADLRAKSEAAADANLELAEEHARLKVKLDSLCDDRQLWRDQAEAHANEVKRLAKERDDARSGTPGPSWLFHGSEIASIREEHARVVRERDELLADLARIYDLMGLGKLGEQDRSPDGAEGWVAVQRNAIGHAAANAARLAASETREACALALKAKNDAPPEVLVRVAFSQGVIRSTSIDLIVLEAAMKAVGR